LSANDFLRAGSVLCFTAEGLARLAPDVRVLATKEGLTAHQASVDIRCSVPPLPPGEGRGEGEP
jgi:histidinol dehydrogenase